MQVFIKNSCFNADWIKTKKEELSGDPVLIEKTIHAFALLGYLVQTETDFVFKGGTSLLLHAPQIKRLSIDIDIIFGGDIEEFNEKLSQIPGNLPFTKFEEDDRGDRGLPNRKHFKFFYKSSILNKEDSVLLDIVLENPSHIPFVLSKPIKSFFFETNMELSVKVPTIEGLLGDKLTAFAPHTIGVPFITKKGKSMTMQVAKQLFDIGELFNIATNFKNIETAFKETFKKENGYHSNEYTEKQVLQDTIDISLALCQIRLKGFSSSEDTNNIEDGIRRLGSHLVNEKFSTDVEAKITASKVFLIANSIKIGKNISFDKIRYSSEKIEQIKDVVLPSSYSKLNRLKPILQEAFYYIWQGTEE